MKMLLLYFIASLTSFSDLEEEKKAITTTLNYYMDGGTNRDFGTLKKAFHEKALMTRIDQDGQFAPVNAREFFSKMKPGDPLKRTTEIVSIDIAGNTAVARLKLEDDNKIFHDFMTLMKIDGKWLIVNKSFHLERKS